MTEGTMEDLLPTIMNAFSLNDTAEETIQSKSSDNTAIVRRRQQQRHNASTESSSIRQNMESRRRRGRQEQQQEQQQLQPNTIEKGYSVSTEGTLEDTMPSIMNALSLGTTSEDSLRRNRSGNIASRRQLEDIIPSIMDTLSLTNESEETIRRNRSDNADSHRQQQQQQRQLDYIEVPLARSKTMESSHRRRRQRQIDSEAEDAFLDAFPEMMDVCSMNGDEKSQTYEKISDFRSNNGRVSMDDDGTKETQNNGVVGTSMSQVYPFMRNVFSMNDIGVNVTRDSTIESLETSGKVGPPAALSRGNSPQRKNKPTQKIVVTRAYEVKEHYLESIFYVSISAILGSVFRVYMARIFGLDCQYNHFNDFLIPLTSNICVTNDGQSEQTGGALFIGFPSNVFGR